MYVQSEIATLPMHEKKVSEEHVCSSTISMSRASMQEHVSSYMRKVAVCKLSESILGSHNPKSDPCYVCIHI